MEGTDPTSELAAAGEAHAPDHGRMHRRLAWIAIALLVLFLLVLVPPLISVNRFQRRIASSIGASLGRPVHLGRVTLTVLPVPGFTLENFVVEEDPAFGAEPVIRAATVHVAVRIRSLWSRRVEFSTISLAEPSVNLVHIENGKWNIESILLQAARIEAAPTAQKRAGPEPRFPYIQASGARINFKLGQEKTPLSLTEAHFALWLSEPGQWHLRIEAKPARTDTAPGDTGTLRLEGTLGRATALRQVPIDLHGEWLKAPLGGASRLLLGRDAGLRGELNLTTDLRGTAGEAAVHTTLAVTQARRADFVPAHTLSVRAACDAKAGNLFHTFSGIECRWPPAGSTDLSLLVLSGSVPDVRQPAAGSAELTLPALPASMLLDWVRVATPAVPEDIQVAGTLAGSISYSGAVQPPAQRWSGQLVLSGGTLSAPGLGPAPMQIGELILRLPSAQAESGKAGKSGLAGVRKLPASRAESADLEDGRSVVLMPVALPLGGNGPAMLEGRFNTSGYTLQLTGSVIAEDLLALGNSIPAFGDGLKERLDEIAKPAPHTRPSEEPTALPAAPFHVDLAATRAWGGAQTWSDLAVYPPVRQRGHSGKR